MIAGIVAALVGAIAMVAVYLRDPVVRLDVSRVLPRSVSGMYPAERVGKTTFAWSRDEARLRFDHVDRRGAWNCRADVINMRPSTAGPADVRIESDGRVLLDAHVSEPRAALDFAIPPASSASSLVFTIAVSPTFVPGPQDRRELGLAFSALKCGPAPGFHPRPSAAIILRGAGSAGAVGAAIGLAGLPLVAAAGISALVAAAQAFALATGGAVHTLASPPMLVLISLLALFCLGPVLVAGTFLRRPLSVAARLAVVISACAFYLKLVFLLHPDKALVDAVFHAHRFDWVLAGNLYFTQLSTSATPFPYAVGLYVFSAPWAFLTRDHVTLLRIVVCASEAVAVLLLYPAVVRAWNDRAAGVMTVALYHLLPLPYGVIGNANLTNDFGQSVALVAMTAAASWAFARRRYLQLAGLTAIAALAFLSHVGTFAVLLPTLTALALLHFAVDGKENRGPGLHILVAAALAVVLAVGLYYAHFGDVYRPHLAGMRATLAAMLGTDGQAAVPAPGQIPDSNGLDAPARPPSPLQLGVRGAIDQTRGGFGLPILSLALIGTWSLFRRRRTDRLVLALTAWGGAWLLFIGWSAFRAVEPMYVQDVWEFIGRVELATAPAVAIIGGYGAVWAWRSGRALRVVSAALVLLAFIPGARAIGGWIF
jgi:hypothetical protein